jgi:hypothetical protein
MAPADKVVSDIALHFCLLKSAVEMKIWPSEEGTDIMVKLLGCRPGFWLALLQVSWA